MVFIKKILAICLAGLNALNTEEAIMNATNIEYVEEVAREIVNEYISDNSINILDYVNDPEPVTELKFKGDCAYFSYNENGERISKEVNNITTNFVYSEGCLIGVENDEWKLEFVYSEEEETELVGFIYEGFLYYYIYDNIGNIIYINNDKNDAICEYDYSEGTYPAVYDLNNGSKVENTNEMFVGNINPYRYQGFYYDFETGYYYTGGGVYYNPVSNEFMFNEITFDTEAYNNDFKKYLMREYNVLEVENKYSVAGTLSEQVSTMYTSLINLSATNASVGDVSAAQWNQGARWYDGRNQTEIIARCIYAENSSPDRVEDRTAEAYVIANLTGFNGLPSTVYGVVTAASRFYVINPPYASIGETANARAAKSPTAEAWKQSLMLACLLTITHNTTQMQTVYAAPEGISSQKLFMSLNLTNLQSFSYSGGYFYRHGIKLDHVAIAGYGEIEGNAKGMYILNSYATYAPASRRWNLFYTFYDEGLV